MSHRHVGLFPASFEFLKTQLLDHKLHAGLRAILSIAQGVEHSNHGFHARDEFIHWSELSKNLRKPRSGTETAACNHPKADGSIRALGSE